MGEIHEIRGVMIPITNGRLLLPNATLAEVITFASAEPVEGAPSWLLGRIGWRGWRLPLYSFSILSKVAEEEGHINAKVAVLKALGGHPRMPFVALLTQGFPRLTTITSDMLLPTGEAGVRAPGVLASIMIRDDHAFVPDLTDIENRVVEALKPAA